MLHSVRYISALFLVLCASVAAFAARDLKSLSAPGVELLVVEAQGCIYCDIFRHKVAPLYAASPRAQRVPMRFADLNDVEASAIAVDGPIDNVPTVLVLRNGTEVARISGYVEPEGFLRVINGLLFRLE